MFPHQNPVYASPLSHIFPAYRILLDFITQTTLGEDYLSLKLLSMYFSLLPFYLVSLRPKYSSQHQILKYPHSPILPQSERPSSKYCQHIFSEYLLLNIWWGRLSVILKQCSATLLPFSVRQLWRALHHIGSLPPPRVYRPLSHAVPRTFFFFIGKPLNADCRPVRKPSISWRYRSPHELNLLLKLW